MQGWDGVLAEMGEERIGDAMHAILYEAGLGGGGNEAFSFPTKEELAVELVAFSVPGVMIDIANKGLGAGEESFKRADKEEVENDFESQLIEIATEAEQIISARNMSIVGNGQINGNNQQYVDMQTQLRDYENESKKQQVYITNEQTNLPIANIETVQYPDGKIASSINAGTEQNSITRPFTQGKLFDTEEQAVEEAKKEITSLG